MAPERKFRRRKSLDVREDLISDLPRHIIDAIMERLPLRDAARLSVLSHKWRDIWTSTPCLSFSAYFFISVLHNRRFLTHEYSGVVSKILLQHDGPIVKFSLCVPRLEYNPDVNQWISFLSRSGIREFRLENQYELPLKLSSQLFSFTWLERLKLHYCVFSPPPTFKGFRRLVTLELYHVKFREGTFEHLITKCPLLEKLSLVKCLGIEHVNVDAPGLKHLLVDGAFRSLCVIKSSNLVSVGIIFDKLMKQCHKSSLRDLIEFLARSSKLEKLSLGGYFCKVLFKEHLIPRTFEKLRNVELQSICIDDPDSFSSVIQIVQRCPLIQNLYISVTTSSNMCEHVLDYNPDITLNHLRSARVGISTASTAELKLIEFLLACSPELEILSLTFLRHIMSSSQLRMSNQLIRFRRASPKVEVILPEEPMISIEFSDSAGDFTSSESSDLNGSSSDASSSDSENYDDSDSE